MATDLDDLNAQALTFTTGAADERRCPEDKGLSVGQAFLAEKPLLLPLAEMAFPDEERLEVHVGKTPYVRFDGNDYSVPHRHVQSTLVLLASPSSVRIIAGSEVVATHVRSWDRDKQLEDPTHVWELAEAKKKKLEVDPTAGEELQKIAKEIMSQPPDVIERLKRLFTN